jgi:hypothetical protein
MDRLPRISSPGSVEHRWNTPRGCPVVPHMHNCASGVGPQTPHGHRTGHRPRRSGSRPGCPGCLGSLSSLSCGQGGCDLPVSSGAARVDIGHPDISDMPRRPGPLGVRCMGVHACMGVHHARAVPDRWVSDPARPMVRCTTTAKPASRRCSTARYRNRGTCSTARPPVLPVAVPPTPRPPLLPVAVAVPPFHRPPLLFHRPTARRCCSTAPRCNQPGTGTGEHVTGPAPSAPRPRYVSQQARERVARPDVWVLPGRGVPEHGNSMGYPRETLEDPLRGFDVPQLSYYIRLFQ